jgi:protein-S-isoprenylcysteine O-methyltransferase Ste14
MAMMLWVNKSIDVLAMVYAVLFFPVPIYWLILHPAVNFWRRFGYRSFWVALPVWLLAGVPLAFFQGPLWSHRLPRNVFTYGLGTVLLGLAFWILVRVHREFSFKKLAGLPELNPRHALCGIVRSGLYAHVRHPRYADLALGFIAWGLLTGSEGIFLLAIVSILMYLIVAPLEERELREQYGSEYEAYARAVPRFLPRLWRRTRKLSR